LLVSGIFIKYSYKTPSKMGAFFVNNCNEVIYNKFILTKMVWLQTDEKWTEHLLLERGGAFLWGNLPHATRANHARVFTMLQFSQ